MTALCPQVFLQHLSPLLSLPTFAALWLTILDFMDKYMHAGSSDLLVRTVLSLYYHCGTHSWPYALRNTHLMLMVQLCG